MKPSNYLVVDNFYNPHELELIEQEVLTLRPFALPSELTFASEGKKTGTGLFLDTMFQVNRGVSKILTLNRKLFSEELCNEAKKINAFFGHMGVCNADKTLLNYYTDGQEYKAHKDDFALTAVTLLGIGEFTGGGMGFEEYNEMIDFKHNRLIVFPSCMDHCALPISSNSGGCRVSIAQFLGYKNLEYKEI